MDQVFSKENKTVKKYWKIGKNTGKVREFCQSGKVGTLEGYIVSISFDTSDVYTVSLNTSI